MLNSYEQARDWLYSLKNQGSTYGIERMEHFAEALGHPEKAYPIIHVAGTNGKGSTAAMLEAIFRAHGFKTGLSTSPHLVRQGERIQVNRSILEEEAIFRYTNELKSVAEEIAAKQAELHPSFFEFMTAMALLHFQREAVDVAIVEVGLGGRLDATNVVTPELAVITSIGLDHCEILGNTHEAIAREKGGIIKPGRPTVIGKLPREAEQAIEDICVDRGSRLVRVEDQLGELPETSLAGDYQRLNAAIALTVATELQSRFDLELDRARAALKTVEWWGRWDRRRMKHRDVIFDVSHNAEGAVWLERNLEGLRKEGTPAPDVIMGVMGAYRAETLVPVVSRFARSLTFVIPQQARASTFEELENCVPADFAGPVARGSIDSLFPAKGDCVLDTPSEHPILVTGSIYLIGEIWERYFEDSLVGQGDLQDF